MKNDRSKAKNNWQFIMLLVSSFHYALCIVHYALILRMRYFIRLAYKGTNYCGWQVQPNANTVQAELEKALTLLLGKTIEVVGCGRTDTGVHASDYYAHFDYNQQIDTAHLLYRLNKFLPNDIGIKDIFRVNEEAHARFSATAREYKYYISKIKDPFTQGQSWFYYGKLDVDLMNEAAGFLLTINDFKAFSRGNTDVKTTLCNVTYARWEELENKLVFTIVANRFLRNMVRAVVGTLAEVGRGKISIEEFKQIANSLDRKEAGESAPAEGLFLNRIEYPKEVTCQL